MTANNDHTVRSMSDEPEAVKPKTGKDDRMIGSLFAEKYEILSLLGQGGMSKVYKARHKFMKRIVAVKLLHESATSDETARARFQQEAEAASALNHQNVVTVHDFGFTPSGQAFFVMDCLEGQTLGDMLEERGSLPLAEALEIFTQGCEGLDHAHRKGIVHRDIKPSNLVIIKQEDGSDLVKLVDFGIAKLMGPAEGEKARQQLTMAGEIFGTPAYMSPEQCNGTPLDARSDIYSFGCLMYESLSGEPPLLGETLISTITKHISERPKPLMETAVEGKVPDHIDAVILKCLEKDPAERYSTALELKQALLDAAYAAGVKGLRVGAIQEPRSLVAGSAHPGASLAEQKVTRKWRVNFVISLILLFLGISGILSWLFLYPGPEGDRGSVFNKVSWQLKQSAADSAIKEGQYPKAVSELESSLALAKTFDDGQSRLQLSLNKLGEVYGLVHNYSAQEDVNSELAEIARNRVDSEYNMLLSLLQDWEKPSKSNAVREERALQASAFADRIIACAQKVGDTSRKKQETLLINAVRVFDHLEIQDWKTRVKFRLSFAACLRAQQRFDKVLEQLLEAEKICPETPSDENGWRLKARVQLSLGQTERNAAASKAELDAAAGRLNAELKMVRVHLKNDKQLLQESLNSLALLERMYHEKEHDSKANSLDAEANALDQ